jgi:hypothetical protein
MECFDEEKEGEDYEDSFFSRTIVIAQLAIGAEDGPARFSGKRLEPDLAA